MPFIWIGFICATGFMEAWVKFIPVNVSFLVALSIGQVVFAALNKVEVVAAIVLATRYILYPRGKHIAHSKFMGVVISFAPDRFIGCGKNTATIFCSPLVCGDGSIENIRSINVWH